MTLNYGYEKLLKFKTAMTILGGFASKAMAIFERGFS